MVASRPACFQMTTRSQLLAPPTMDSYSLTLATAWVLRRKLGEIPYLAINNNPAVVWGVVLRDVVDGKERFFKHCDEFEKEAEGRSEKEEGHLPLPTCLLLLLPSFNGIGIPRKVDRRLVFVGMHAETGPVTVKVTCYGSEDSCSLTYAIFQAHTECHKGRMQRFKNVREDHRRRTYR